MNYPNNSRRKFQTADGKTSHFRLVIQLYKSRLQTQTEKFIFQTENLSKNHFPSGNCNTPSNQYQRAIPPDGNSVNKNLENSRRKIRFSPYYLWDQRHFPDGNTSPYY
jgi:hypothetical protein